MSDSDDAKSAGLMDILRSLGCVSSHDESILGKALDCKSVAPDEPPSPPPVHIRCDSIEQETAKRNGSAGRCTKT